MSANQTQFTNEQLIPSQLDATTLNTYGIMQSDIIIRTAIVAAIKDIRDNPWILDYCFAWMIRDDQTAAQYGQMQVMEAKRWFMKVELPVYMNMMNEPPKIPAITISLLGGGETDVTLGDKNPEGDEDLTADPPAIGPFVPKSWNMATGVMKLPDDIQLNYIIVPGMAMVGTDGKTRYAITDVDDDGNVTLSPNISADFTKVTVHYRLPVARIQLESVEEKEDYLIGVFADEPAKLLILASIMKMALYRYKQQYLEGRGLEKTTFTTADVTKYRQIDPEIGYSRYFSLTGYVRQYWPKNIVPTIQAVDTKLVIRDSGKSPSDQDPNVQLWVGDEDVLAGLGSSGSNGS